MQPLAYLTVPAGESLSNGVDIAGITILSVVTLVGAGHA
jgi:hypothetical protein